jgi:ABC-type amino acid transport substrate-binding protein
MKKWALLIAAVIAAVMTPAYASDKNESIYDRVMRTGTLRCGYFAENPFTIIDPNTNEKTGIAVEIAQAVTSQLGLKLEWAEEVNFATLVTDLDNGRYDAICASVFNIPRGGRTDYTTPYIYVPTYGYVRPVETRFDTTLDAVNNKDVTVAILDGEGSSTIASRFYPLAKHYSLPQASEISQMLLAVADKKADIGFALPSVFEQFNKSNPNKLRPASTKPLYVFSVSFAVRPGEQELKNMLDIMLKQMIVSGEVDRIVDKYETKPGTFLRVKKPY